MSNIDIIVGILIIIIPLTLLVLCYRTYIFNNYQNDINRMIKKQPEHEIEGFFGGISDWFTGNSSSTLPVSPGSLEPENLSILERKINDKMKKSDVFPPNELQGNTDDFKDSDNSSILGNTGTILPLPVAPKIEVKPPPIQTPIQTPIIAPQIQKPDLKSLFGSCQFYSDRCPDNYLALGNFSIEGIESNSILSCGNIINTKPGKAIAQIKNNSVYEIHIIDPGHGYLPSNPPKVKIEGGKGHGAAAESVIDDDGFLKIIKIIDKGYNYAETPNVFIDPPMMNSSCHLCCNIP